MGCELARRPRRSWRGGALCPWLGLAPSVPEDLAIAAAPVENLVENTEQKEDLTGSDSEADADSPVGTLPGSSLKLVANLSADLDDVEEALEERHKTLLELRRLDTDASAVLIGAHRRTQENARYRASCAHAASEAESFPNVLPRLASLSVSSAPKAAQPLPQRIRVGAQVRILDEHSQCHGMLGRMAREYRGAPPFKVEIAGLGAKWFDRIEIIGGGEVGSATSSTAVPNSGHKEVRLRGFALANLNVTYSERATAEFIVNDKPTYYEATNNYFIYFDAVHEDWRLGAMDSSENMISLATSPGSGNGSLLDKSLSNGWFERTEAEGQEEFKVQEAAGVEQPEVIDCIDDSKESSDDPKEKKQDSDSDVPVPVPQQFRVGHRVRHIPPKNPDGAQLGVVIAQRDDGLQVRLGACGRTPWFQTEVTVQASELVSEADWWHRAVRICDGKNAQLAKDIEESQETHKETSAKMAKCEERMRVVDERRQRLRDRVSEGTSFARVVRPVTCVRFVDEARPKVWRDVSKHASFVYGVRLDKTDAPSVELSLADAAVLARAVKRKGKMVPPFKNHLLVVKGESLGALGKTKRALRRGGPAVLLQEKDAKRIRAWAKKAREPPKSLPSIALMKAALGVGSGISLDAQIQKFFDDPLTGIIKTKEVEVPEILNDVLRPYQRDGFKWLVSNARNGLGCILADDMGLGKTIQAISLFLYLKAEGVLDRPALVVVPKALLTVWSREVSRWAPKMRVHVYHGQSRTLLEAADLPSGQRSAPQKNKRLIRTGGHYDVFLTSYGTIRSDADLLVQEQRFSCMVLDEAQQIKNYHSMQTKGVKKVAETVGTIRVALSGTPVENRLSDLHSQFEFILPGFLAESRAEFEREYGKPLQKAVRGEMSQEVALERRHALQHMIKPFVLRRLKSDPAIAADLPDKIEQVHACELTDTQKNLYEAVIDQKEKLIKQAESEEADEEGKPGEALRRRGRILAILHALREVCNHPANLKSTRRPEDFKLAYPAREDWEASGKCAVLQSLLDGILTGGDKVLIFCNLLETIAIIVEQIQAAFKDCKPLVFTGDASVEERARLVDTFQNDPTRQVMILSLQAGGVGITLTAATHVIHFDRCYNPAKENQATDRAHRIGQTKTVFVHRLTTLNTFEEKLEAIMAQKQSLSDITLQAGDSWIADLGEDELRDLFRLSGSKESGDAEDDEPAPKRRRAESKDPGEVG